MHFDPIPAGVRDHDSWNTLNNRVVIAWHVDAEQSISVYHSVIFIYASCCSSIPHIVLCTSCYLLSVQNKKQKPTLDLEHSFLGVWMLQKQFCVAYPFLSPFFFPPFFNDPDLYSKESVWLYVKVCRNGNNIWFIWWNQPFTCKSILLLVFHFNFS